MAEVYGLTPSEVDALSLPDVAVMAIGAHRRVRLEQHKQTRGWKQTAEVVAMIYNMGGPRSEKFRPRRAADIFPQVYDESGQERSFDSINHALQQVAQNHGE